MRETGAGRSWRALAVVGAALGVALSATGALHPRPGRALPLFTRQTGLGCDHCHDATPHLNSRGLEYLAHGYRFVSEPLPAHIRTIPVSAVASVGLGFSRLDSVDTPHPDRDDLGARRERESVVELHTAGAARRASWHLQERIGTRSGVLDTPSAWAQVNDLAAHAALNVRAGRFTTGLPFLVDSRRTTLAPYATPVTLDVRGLELNGTGAGWTYAGGLVENHRTLPGGQNPVTRAFTHLQDTYAWVSRGFGGQQLGVRVWFDRQDSDLSFHTWLQHMQHEVAGSFTIRSLQVIPAYVLDRYDDRPAAELHDKHHHAMLEVVAPLDGARRWLVSGRYEHEYRTGTPYSPEWDRQHAALDLAFDPRPDTRLALEWSHAADNIGGPRTDAVDAYFRIGY
jgi:hypothetical protein